MTDTEAIALRANSATPGPWTSGDPITSRNRDEEMSVPVYAAEWIGPDQLAEWGVIGETMIEADADFIAHARADIPELLAKVRAGDERIAALTSLIEDAARQWGYWSEREGGVGTGGLSTLEDIFEALGWEDPHPLPDRRCDEPECMKDATCGWPTGLAEPRYRHTCYDHSSMAAEKAARDKP